MGDTFVPIPTAEAWQLSNPPIFQMAAINASLDIFSEAGMDRLRQKSERLTGYLQSLLDAENSPYIEVITPRDTQQRGCQLSIRVRNSDKSLFTWLTKQNVVADWREPDVIRVAPVPLYNSFQDVWYFSRLLHEGIKHLHA
jgi:kynureninase